MDSFGIARGTALEMVSLYGDMATGMKVPQREAAEMSKALVGLAGDMSSYKNVSLDVAQNALKGIFTGEGESLKSLGIIMTDTTLKQYAMSQGIKKNYAEMTQAEKVQLRYNYVLETAKNAQGDFANTSDGTANSVRILRESLKELGEEFGKELLPIITPIIQALTNGIKCLGDMDGEAKKLIVTIGLVVAVAGPLLMLIGSISSGLSALGGVMSWIAANPIVLIIAAIVALVAIFSELWNTNENFRKFFIDTWEKIKNFFKGIGDFFVDLFEKKIPGSLEKMVNFFKKMFDALVDLVKIPVNFIIEILNKAIDGINSFLKAISGTVKIPDWVPLLGGGTLGFENAEIPKIPLLAKGGILSEGDAIIAEAGPEPSSM